MKGGLQDLILKTENGDSITRCRKAMKQGRNNNSFSINDMYVPKEEFKKRPLK